LEIAGSRAAVLGVRPEDVSIAPLHQRQGQTPATVRVIEMLGDSAVLTLEAETAEAFEVLCKTEPRAAWRVGDRVGMQINADRVHAFDPHSGKNWVRRLAVG
jgi:multiple sugar transport system ATP-binding protein